MESGLIRKLNFRHFSDLPLATLNPSATVDFILLFSGAKPAVRLYIADNTMIRGLQTWSLTAGLDFTTDTENFVAISQTPGYSKLLLDVDRKYESHEKDLGLMLGYPNCCSTLMAQIGESNIDKYAQEVSDWVFQGNFRRIDPSNYSAGISLISHLPCSPTCTSSLVIANIAREFVLAHPNSRHLGKLYESGILS